MNNEERLKLIEEKKKQLEILRDEIKELKKQDQPILLMINTEPIAGVIYFERENKCETLFANGSGGDVWDNFRRMACSLFFNYKHDCRDGRIFHECRFKKQKDMTEHEKKVAIDFLNEIIPIYNKYVIRENPTITNGQETIELWGDE